MCEIKDEKISDFIETRLYIGGKFVEATSNSFWDNINPATEEIICKVQEASEADVELAVDAAVRAYDEWSSTDPRIRAKCINKLADLIEIHKEMLSKLESLDNGKPAHIARDHDIKLVVDTFRYYAGWADKIHGKTISVESIGSPDNKFNNNKYFCYTRLEPVGVVAQIIPWNFPLLMLAWKLAPALAVGCTVVLKTSEKTPLSALAVAKFFSAAGFPDGVVNILCGFGPTVGNSLVSNHRINKVAFTGSSESGLKVLTEAAQSGLKRTTLELGGKSPLIIFEDFDLEHAVKIAHSGLFYNMGQCCIASSRIFVQESVYDKFVEMCKERAEQSVLCDPLNPKCTHGPQIDKIQYDKILRYINCGKNEGAVCITGGRPKDGPGYWIEPTIFIDVEDEMTIATEEIFGPVMCIMKFKSIDEVIKRSNCTKYGLGAGVCTRDIGKAVYVSNKLKAGTVYINCYDVFDPAAPFGGYKQSGQGRELGEYGLNPYLESKTVIADISFQH